MGLHHVPNPRSDPGLASAGSRFLSSCILMEVYLCSVKRSQGSEAKISFSSPSIPPLLPTLMGTLQYQSANTVRRPTFPLCSHRPTFRAAPKFDGCRLPFGPKSPADKITRLPTSVGYFQVRPPPPPKLVAVSGDSLFWFRNIPFVF